MTTYISEIFSSIQGEGLYVGDLHIFVRFNTCNLTCKYCDTKKADIKQPTFEVTLNSGVKTFYDNPISAEDFLSIFENYSDEVIALTGGEPLLNVDFLCEVLPKLKENGNTIFLETNGTLINELKRVIKYCDIISMDYKLPNMVANSGSFDISLHDLHREFLYIANSSEVFVKMVVDSDTELEEVLKCAQMMNTISGYNYLILQPVTGMPDKIPTQEQLMAFLVGANEFVPTKVIPQCHKAMNIS